MAAPDTIDESLYSRQLYVLGHDAMKQMSSSSVLVVGLQGLGAEIAKNIALAGVKSVTLYDPHPVATADLGTQFFLREQDVAQPGVTRASATAPRLAELNTYVPVKVLDVPQLTRDVLAQFRVVVLAQQLLAEELRIDDMVRAAGTHFICASVRGLFGSVFVDLGAAFVCRDTNGESPLSGMVVSVAQDEEGLVTTLDETRHGLEDGDFVTFDEVKGMTQLNGIAPRPVTVKGPYTFAIGDTSSFHAYESGGLFKQVKQPKTLSFQSLAASRAAPDCLISDFAKMDRPPVLHAGFEALSSFVAQHGRFPRPRNAADADALAAQGIALLEERGQLPDDVDLAKRLLRELAFQAVGDLSPMVAFIGGFVAQEVLKACSGKFHPLQQYMYVDALEALPDAVPSAPEAEFAPQGTRYDRQVAVVGRAFQERIANARQFLVGAGAIGCEMLKNWSMMGLGSGPQGKIFVTDMDTIEKSNLNRQFLFRPADVGQFKADTAAAAVAAMNPALVRKIESFQNRVGTETEDVYGDAFFGGLDVVTNALDNVAARQYMDRRCVYFQKPLLESGTLGTKANTQVVIPNLTESYSSSQDPPEKSIPVCTLKNFPNQIEHTIQWAREQFDELFTRPAENVNEYLTQPDYVEAHVGGGDATRRQQLEQVKSFLVDQRPQTFDACIAWARLQFEENHANVIKQLLHNLPRDAVTSSGQPFWSGPKRAPTPLVFDAHNPVHLAYVIAAANLHAENYGLKGVRDPAYFVNALAHVHVPAFTPRANVKIQVNENDPAPAADPVEESVDVEELVASLPAPTSLSGYRMQPVELEKDDDTNHHIDFITAASNLRALNYAITPVDRHTTKGIAGKIIPAIATTTALATGLVNLELYKVLDHKTDLEKYSNAFANLALPFIAFSDPIAAPKNKFNDTEWTLWSRFDIDGDIALRAFVDFFKEKHALDVTMVSSGVSMLYSDFMPSKKKEERLALPISELVQTVSRKPLPPHVTSLIVEIMADDASGEDVEVPYVNVRLR
ncbi:E1 ubiquitin-activating enzyme [Malassezia sp. CBS 17886]|nr:E1 ubiquitin-activating enzyme [Malassezia sp. CBS 17886]